MLLPNKGHIYVIRLWSFYKIGITSSIDTRLAGFMTAFPEVPEVVFTAYSNEMRVVERSLHAMFEAKRVNGEWFALDIQDIEVIRSIFED